MLGVYDFLLSDEHNRSYNTIYPGSSRLYNGSEWEMRFWKNPSINHKTAPHSNRGLLKVFWNKLIGFCKKQYPYLSLYKAKHPAGGPGRMRNASCSLKHNWCSTIGRNVSVYLEGCFLFFLSIDLLQKTFIKSKLRRPPPPPIAMWSNFMVDGWTSFLSFKIPLWSLEEPESILLWLRLCSSERRKSYTPRLAWGRDIFIFGWTYPCLNLKMTNLKLKELE